MAPVLLLTFQVTSWPAENISLTSFHQFPPSFYLQCSSLQELFTHRLSIVSLYLQRSLVVSVAAYHQIGPGSNPAAAKRNSFWFLEFFCGSHARNFFVCLRSRPFQWGFFFFFLMRWLDNLAIILLRFIKSIKRPDSCTIVTTLFLVFLLDNRNVIIQWWFVRIRRLLIRKSLKYYSDNE